MPPEKAQNVTSFETILLAVNSGVATLTLNRAERLNAMNAQLVRELNQALAGLRDREDVRVLLLTGEGRAFCSGADLAVEDLQTGEPDLGRDLELYFNPLVESLFALPFPIVAAVNGAAAGGGCGLALAADVVVAGQSAYFLQPYCNLGLVPDVGSTWMLPRQVGRARASGMMLLGQRVSAEIAEQWGLIWKCVPDQSLMEEARLIAAQLARGPTRALALTRAAIRNAIDGTLSAALSEERNNQLTAGRTIDFAEGINAFLEKREPVFVGK